MTARVPLPDQIAALDTAIERLQRRYLVAVNKGQMRKRDAEAHLAGLRAVRRTLAWMRDNEHLIRGAIVGGAVKHAV
jgi:hypothetical protein